MTTTLIISRSQLLARAIPTVLLALAASHASATITTLPSGADDSSPFLMDKVIAFGVTGAQMADRLSITATFMSVTGAPITETRPWLLDGGVPDGGHAVGSAWTMEQAGDTFSNPWTLTVQRGMLLRSLQFKFESALTGEGIVFDRTVGGVEGTPGTAQGQDFLVTFSTAGPLDTWVASPKYARPGDVPTDSVAGFYGDIYANLDVAFDGQPFFTTAPYQVQFTQDCDITTPVPTPGALAMLGASSFTAALRRRRR